MGDRTSIKFTAAERASFELLPETCPEIEKAFDVAFRSPDFGPERVAEIMAKNGIELTPENARHMRYALHELMERELFPRKVALQKVVQMRGTFPLRHALVLEISRGRGLENERNNYAYWLRHEVVR